MIREIQDSIGDAAASEDDFVAVGVLLLEP